MTANEVFKDFLAQLKIIYEEREAHNITEWIFDNVTNLKKWQRRESVQHISEEQSELLKSYLSALLEHKPVQYVLNEAWFYKKKFYVNEDVLIPRPETEELVEWIINAIINHKYNKKLKILDIGTGSGCIAITLKKELRNVQVTAIDASEKALWVARKNAEAMQTELDFITFDFLKQELWNSFARYDIIVSNPPYIPEKEKISITKNVVAFEPEIALFVPDENQFIFYEKIAAFAQSHLNLRGKIFVEINENSPKEVSAIFNSYHFKTEIRKDIYGKERMVKAINTK